MEGCPAGAPGPAVVPPVALIVPPPAAGDASAAPGVAAVVAAGAVGVGIEGVDAFIVYCTVKKG
jgi:hypothetical protein